MALASDLLTSFFPMFLTFFEPFLVGKVMKENHIRKVRKSEKRKVKKIGKIWYHRILSLYYALVSDVAVEKVYLMEY